MTMTALSISMTEVNQAWLDRAKTDRTLSAEPTSGAGITLALAMRRLS